MSVVELPRRTGTLRVVFGVLLLLVGCEGCTFRDRCVHDPPLARNVPRIVRGQTTGTQIVQYFGVPDLEAHGSKVTLNDDSAMGEQRQKIKQALERVEMAPERYGTNSERRIASGTDLFDEMLRLWAYSSIDEDHVAYLYWETSFGGNAVFIPTPVGHVGGTESRLLQNRLLILINKHTGVVDEFGLRQEFDTR